MQYTISWEPYLNDEIEDQIDEAHLELNKAITPVAFEQWRLWRSACNVVTKCFLHWLKLITSRTVNIFEKSNDN